MTSDDGEVTAVLLLGFIAYDREKETPVIDSEPQPTFLVYTIPEWEAFLAGAKEGEFDSAGDKMCLVRDSKNPDDEILSFFPDHFKAFLDRLKQGDYDLPDEAS